MGRQRAERLFYYCAVAVSVHLSMGRNLIKHNSVRNEEEQTYMTQSERSAVSSSSASLYYCFIANERGGRSLRVL